MTKLEAHQARTEKFVEAVLRDTFHQNPKQDEIKNVAQRVAKVVPVIPPVEQMIAAGAR